MQGMKSCASAGACNFAARPDWSALEQPIYWTPDIDPGVVNLIETPSNLALGQGRARNIAVEHAVFDESGHNVRLLPLPGCQLRLHNGVQPGRPMSAVIPLDAYARDRLWSIERFIRLQSGDNARDERLTAAQRRRLVLMLRAIDAREEDASLFEIAVALFGRRLVDRSDWPESTFRYVTQRLVRDGLKMIGGGYRQLLAFRRRPSGIRSDRSAK